jgi:FtsH-binding integral membrane protein
MNLSRLFNQWRAFILGAINGLLFGGAAEVAREIYFEYEYRMMVESHERQGIYIWPQVIDLLRWHFIPSICLVVFSVGSLLIHRYRQGRPKSLLLLWQLIGVVCATVSFIVEAAIEQRGNSELVWKWLFCLALVLVINSIYGATIKMFASYYSQNKRVDFP